MDIKNFNDKRTQDRLIRSALSSKTSRASSGGGSSSGSPGGGGAVGSVAELAGDCTGQPGANTVVAIQGTQVVAFEPKGGQVLSLNAEGSYEPTRIYIAEACRVAVGVNIDISAPGATQDGVTLSEGDRVLLYGQGTPAQNGAYLFVDATSPLERTFDANTGENFKRGLLFPILEGTQANRVLFCNSADDIEVGVDAIEFSVMQDLVAARINSTGTVFRRGRLNLIPGANIQISGSDDSGNNEIDLSFSSSLRVREADGSPSLDATILELDNGTVSDLGGGVVRYTPTASGVTIVERDGSPSVANATTLRVQNGFLSNLSAGVALLDFPVSSPVVLEDGTVVIDEYGNPLIIVSLYSEFAGV